MQRKLFTFHWASSVDKIRLTLCAPACEGMPFSRHFLSFLHHYNAVIHKRHPSIAALPFSEILPLISQLFPTLQARDIQKEPMLSSLPALLGVLPEVTGREGTWWGSHKSHPDLISWSCAHPFADRGSSSVRQRQTELSFSVVATHMYILMPSCSTVKLRHFPCFCCFY